jgi:hypothetical protein
MSWFDNSANTGVDDGGGGGMSSMINSMRGMDWGNIGSGLGSLFGNAMSMGTASNVNNQVQQGLQQNNAATQAQIDALTNQINTNRQQAQDMYQRSLGDVTTQNQGLQGNIDTMSGSLSALSDPNSPYMQMARQAIERKDAAAGRRSQWGEREVQLAATLSDQVGKYAPGLNNSITSARDQIARNNQGLASLYSTANQPADRNTMAQLAALQQQLSNTNAANTTGRESANRVNSNMNSLLNSGGRLAGGLLGGLFGGGGDSGTGSIMNYYGNQAGVDNGITGFGGGIGSYYGNSGLSDAFGSTSYSPIGSIYDNPGASGYGSFGAGDYFGGGGFGGVPTLGGGGDVFDMNEWM